jgi:hypothetical protein
VAGLCSNADKLDARATDPKTRLHPRHARQSGIPTNLLRIFVCFDAARNWQRLCSE